MNEAVGIQMWRLPKSIIFVWSPFVAGVLLCIGVGAVQSAAPDPATLERLQARKEQLERELAAVVAEIERHRERGAINSDDPASAVSEPRTPTHYINAFGLWEVNSAGGVEPSIHVVNPNPKSPIKYLHISLQLYNRVGAPIRSTLDGLSVKTVSYTGPLQHGTAPYRAQWDPVWYNHSGWCLRIVELTVQFMDGSRKTFGAQSVAKAIKPGLDNSCPAEGPRFRE